MENDTLYILVYIYIYIYTESWDNAVGIAARCDGAGRPKYQSSSKNFLLFVQTVAGAYPVSCPKDTGGCLLWDKAA
jgi:hypothetical protein